jgi:hypothetical protein
LFVPLVGDAAKKVRGAGDRLRKIDPDLYESLLEAKMCVVSGFLPEAGGLNRQDPSLKATLEWLTRAGILEWVRRSPM